jgi:hypothetical protein
VLVCGGGGGGGVRVCMGSCEDLYLWNDRNDSE